MLEPKTVTAHSYRSGQDDGKQLNQPFSPVIEESRKASQYFFHTKRLSQDDDHGFIFLFSHNRVQPVIQNGPMCGLVALAMASQLTSRKSVTVEDALSEAKRRGFSKQGEMFSATSLQELATHFLPCKSECVRLKRSETTQCLDGKDIIEQLMKRNLVLIPYDADKNHSPCQKKGHKAHWALLTGFFIALNSLDVHMDLVSHCAKLPDNPALHFWPDDPDLQVCDHLAQLAWEKAADVFVLGHHGKSRHAGLWRLNDLLLSNDNLLEAGPERGPDEYVIPVGGVECGLKSQFVAIYSKSDR